MLLLRSMQHFGNAYQRHFKPQLFLAVVSALFSEHTVAGMVHQYALLHCEPPQELCQAAAEALSQCPSADVRAAIAAAAGDEHPMNSSLPAEAAARLEQLEDIRSRILARVAAAVAANPDHGAFVDKATAEAVYQLACQVGCGLIPETGWVQLLLAGWHPAAPAPPPPASLEGTRSAEPLPSFPSRHRATSTLRCMSASMPPSG